MVKAGDERPFSQGELRLVDGLAQRWHISPGAVLAEDVGLVMGIIDAVGEQPVELPSEDDMMRDRLLNQTKVTSG